MKQCNEPGDNILLYLDNALRGQSLEEFRAHLASCADCAARLEEERALSALLRKSRPLYTAPEGLRTRVVAASAQTASATNRESRGDSLWESLTWRWQQKGPTILPWKVLVATVLVLALGLVFVPDVAQRARATAYVAAATQAHRSYLNGELPLQCRSDSPAVVTAWFLNKTPFHFQLPASQSSPGGKAAYRLTGARLVSYKGSPIALVAYETETEKISLLVASDKSAAAAGGDEVRSGGLTFHYRTSANFNVITWSNHGLTYALVSSLAGSAEHSCMVCHQGIANHVAFRRLSR